MTTEINRLYEAFKASGKISTDSRIIENGCVFFAFKGENFDAGEFVGQALEKGAAMCVTENEAYKGDPRCVVTPDVLGMLQQLAICYRKDLKIPFIGVTGTNGKTTTKELMYAVLSRKYKTCATVGNHNNHLGVPLTILSIPKDAEIAIVEMGANHPGEITDLCRISDPDMGVITNVGKAHLEGFGGFEGVVNTKTALYRHLAGKGGTVFVDASNERLMRESQIVPHRYTYGENGTVKGHCLGSNPEMKFYVEEGDNVYNIQTHLIGNYNFANAMAAVCVGRRLGVEMFDIKEALESYVPQNNRSQFKQTSRNRLVMDCYNANPSSMKVSLENFAGMDGSCKVAMLGEMKELGAESEAEHRNVLEQALTIGLNSLVLVGKNWEEVKSPSCEVYRFETSGEAADYFQAHPLDGATILLKGSNGTKMWLLADVL